MWSRSYDPRGGIDEPYDNRRLCRWLCLSGPAIAHHSVGINFDAAKAFTLTGVLKELDIRNPHSQITLAVKGADGTLKEWFIEWSDKNALIRRKVGYERMKIGETLAIRMARAAAWRTWPISRARRCLMDLCSATVALER